MNVRVRYWKPEIQGFGGRDYLYCTDLPVEKGTIVVSPTASNPMQAGIVTQTDIPDSEVRFSLREITEIWEGEMPT